MRYVIHVYFREDMGDWEACIDNWYTRVGHGNTPSEAIKSAVDGATDWIDPEEKQDEFPEVDE